MGAPSSGGNVQGNPLGRAQGNVGHGAETSLVVS